MTRSLSLRARLFGVVSQLLLKPVLAAPAHEMRIKLERIAKLITILPRGTRIEALTLAGRPAEKLTPAGRDQWSGAVLPAWRRLSRRQRRRTHRGMLAHVAKASGCNGDRDRLPAGAGASVSGRARRCRGRLEGTAGAMASRRREPGDRRRFGRRQPGAGHRASRCATPGCRCQPALVLLSPWTDMSPRAVPVDGQRAPSRDRLLTPCAASDRAAARIRRHGTAAGRPAACRRCSPRTSRACRRC